MDNSITDVAEVRIANFVIGKLETGLRNVFPKATDDQLNQLAVKMQQGLDVIHTPEFEPIEEEVSGLMEKLFDEFEIDEEEAEAHLDTIDALVAVTAQETIEQCGIWAEEEIDNVLFSPGEMSDSTVALAFEMKQLNAQLQVTPVGPEREQLMARVKAIMVELNEPPIPS